MKLCWKDRYGRGQQVMNLTILCVFTNRVTSVTNPSLTNEAWFHLSGYDDKRIISRNLWPPRSPDLTTPDNICYRVRPVYVIDVYKLTPSNGPKERSRRARDLTVASDNLSAIEFRPGDFFFNVEPVIRNEATHRKIVFRVGILA
ncbi:hypothetical protein ANN_12131 [Periplaneta americana]|uniref:Uncharacterized protein n=1 Tax=Periplaneta americana TaxID=6978 RepID=A0ABQ8T8T1_PERAM|nr:hypothetical protein ANN_12131 [Periplaneta americana]